MSRFQGHKDWPFVKNILDKINSAGFTAWLAGGCVRDHLLGISPKDFDIATNALPSDIQELFPEALEVGRAFGIMILVEDNIQVEIATFRKDGDYHNGRHPESVLLGCTAEEDAHRRDFTMNALFYSDREDKIYDYVNGIDDIKNKIIRCVGDPLRRFQEDQLRILRALRFSAQLDFEIEDNTLEAIHKIDKPLSSVSKERILVELEKFIVSSYLKKGFHYLKALPLVIELLPFSQKSNEGWVRKEFLLKAVKINDLGRVFSWAGFLLPEEKEGLKEVSEWLKEFPFSKADTSGIENALKFYFNIPKNPEDQIPYLIAFEKSKLDLKFFEFCHWVCLLREENNEFLDSLMTTYKTKMTEVGKLPKPLLGGNDLMEIGIKKGPQIGDLLQDLYIEQLSLGVSEKSRLLNSKLLQQACTSKEV